jgi:hypothetical protein
MPLILLEFILILNIKIIKPKYFIYIILNSDFLIFI